MRSPRVVLLTIGVWALVAAFAVLAGGVPVGWAILIGLPAGVLTFAALTLSGTFDAEWTLAPAPLAGHVTMHATFLTERLEQSAPDSYRYTSRVQPRLRRIAAAALHDDLDSASAREKLGPDLHHLLTAPDAELPPPPRFAALMRRLEDLC